MNGIMWLEQKLIKLNMIIAMNSNDFWEGLDVYKIMVEWIENIVFVSLLKHYEKIGLGSYYKSTRKQCLADS